MRKNILVLDTGKEWGGGTNSLLELLCRTDKKKYKFTALFYFNYAKPGESDIKTEIEKLGIEFLLFDRRRQPVTAKILKESGRALLFFSKNIRRLYLFWVDYFFRIKKDSRYIAKLLKALNANLIYMNNQPSTNLEGILAAKAAGINSLLHSRIETGINFFEVNAVNKWLTKMICVSEGVRESFVKQGVEPSMCVTVYNGIDVGIIPSALPDKIRQELGIKEDEILIGSAGSLVRRKRFDDLINAVSSIRALNSELRTQKIKCVILGEGPEKEQLQGEIWKNKLKDSVMLIGFKSDAISYINAMDIFILPSEREGFSRVILEAMLMGKPVIASKIVGPSELVVDGMTGFLYKTADIESLSEHILRLAVSPSLREDMGKAGRRKVIENFSIEKYVSGVEQVFDEVLSH